MTNFCTLFSGSSGNSTFIKDKDTNILVDAGKSGKTIEKSLGDIGQSASEISAILITHEHSDHTKGVGILSRRYNIPVYANQKTWDAMKKNLGEIADHNMKIFNTNEEFYIDAIKIKPFDIPHDAVEPVGYSFFIDSKK